MRQTVNGYDPYSAPNRVSSYGTALSTFKDTAGISECQADEEEEGKKKKKDKRPLRNEWKVDAANRMTQSRILGDRLVDELIKLIWSH